MVNLGPVVFFFPLFRDGVRSLTFLPNASLSDLNTLLGVFEIKDRDLGTDDTVTALWRGDFSSIRYKALDDWHDVEAATGESLRKLINQTAAQIAQTTVPVEKTSTSADDKNVREIGYDYALIRRTVESGLDELRRGGHFQRKDVLTARAAALFACSARRNDKLLPTLRTVDRNLFQRGAHKATS